jgi:flagellar basal body-associated protein FliL
MEKRIDKDANMTVQEPPRRLLLLSRILLIAAFLLLALILGGTLYALVFRSQTVEVQTTPAVSAVDSAETAIFTGLGRLRFPAAGPAGGTVVLSVAFPYYPGDRPFSEELASRVRDLREITIAYLGSLNAEELVNTDEAVIKEELLSRYNDILRLGRIEILYFNDFMIIE